MLKQKILYGLSRLRWHVRKQPWVGVALYMVPNIFYALAHKSGNEQFATGGGYSCRKLAVCLRFRDEARFLEEWLEYYLAAGVEHFFMYNNFSSDGYQEVLKPYQERGQVTLIDWPHKPASPGAEHDCIERTRGRFDWVGFIDADEFVVIRDGRSIPDFLDEFGDVPAVALHWYYFGSNAHEQRPQDWVIKAYTRRAAKPNHHFKVFVRPEQVTRNRNSHNFYYRRARCAVREDGRLVFGSIASPPSVEKGWINHYYCKSLEDYLEKAARRSTLDKSGIKEPSRQKAVAQAAMVASNDVEDRCSIEYFEQRRAASVQEMSVEGPS
jgi:hypothetical protein